MLAPKGFITLHDATSVNRGEGDALASTIKRYFPSASDPNNSTQVVFDDGSTMVVVEKVDEIRAKIAEVAS